MKFKILLNNAKEAEEFVNAASNCGADVDLHSGVVYIDGKSLLGVLAMGIRREMSLHISASEIDPAFSKIIKKFVIA